jgi:RHS repeat-associated protein
VARPNTTTPAGCEWLCGRPTAWPAGSSPIALRPRSGQALRPRPLHGQRIEDNTDLYFYQSRWYDPVVGRFIQPDSIVPEPGNPQALNRYTYVANNPLRFIDPSGHSYIESEQNGSATLLFEEIELVLGTKQQGFSGQNTHNRAIWLAARNADISPKLLKAMVAGETGGTFDTNLVSGTDAVGLMQLTGRTAREMGLAVSENNDERFNAFKNLEAGAEYLRRMYDMFGGASRDDRWKLSATAYTAGLGTVRKAQSDVRAATPGSTWHGRDANTFAGLTSVANEASTESPLSVSAYQLLGKGSNYVNREVMHYIDTIDTWLGWLRY